MSVPDESAASGLRSTLGWPHDFDTTQTPRVPGPGGVGQPGFSPRGLTLLATAIAQLSEGVVITDVAGTIQYINPAFTRITGYTGEEAVGKNTRLLKSDRQDPAAYEGLWKTILAEEVWRGELISRRKDGTFYTEELSITPVRDGGGTLSNFIAVMQDVTARRATETALSISKKSLNEAQNIAPLGGWEFDVHSREFRGSEGFFRIVDLHPTTATLNVRTVLEAIPPADHERISRAARNTFRTHEPFDVEHRLARRDGTVRIVRSRGQVIEGLGGALRLVGTTIDITEGKRAHEELRRSEEKFRSLVANIPDVVWTIDSLGHVVFISPNIEKLGGYTAEEVCQKGLSLLFETMHPADVRRTRETLDAAFRDRQPREVEYRGHHKDGRRLYVRARTMAAYEKDGVLYLHGLLSDVTERKQAEEALRASEERFRLFMNNSPTVAWMKDDQGRYVYISEPYQRHFNIQTEDRLGETDFDIYPTAIAEQFRKNDLEAMEAGHSIELTEESLSFDGEPSSWLVYKFPFQDATGQTFVAGIGLDITKRKQAEEALRESEDRFRTTFECAAMGMALVDKGGYPFKSNPALRQMLGYSEDELSRMTFTEFTHPADRELDWDLYCELAAGQRDSYAIEKRYYKKDGDVLWGLLTVSFVKNRLGRPLYGVGVVQDITERKQAEEALRRSEARLKEALRAAQMGAWEWNQAANTVTWDENLYRIAGRDPRLPALDYSEQSQLFVAESWQRLGEAVENALTSGTAYELDLQLVRPDGSKRWVIDRGEPTRDAGGLITGLRGTVQDITERKQAEENLRNAHELINAVVQASPEAITVLDSEGLVRMWNPGAEKMFGWTAEEVLGRPLPYVPPADRANHLARVTQTAQGAPLSNIELRRSRKDGTPVDFLLSTAPMFDHQGKVVTYLGVMNDITERKRAEEALAQERNLLRTVIDNLPGYVYVKDIESRFVVANNGLAHLLRVEKAQDLTGRTDFDYFPEPLAENYRRQERAVIESGEPVVNGEKIVVDGFGNGRWLLNTQVPFRDVQGKIIGLVGISHDITERKQMELRLRKLSCAVEQSPASVIITNVRGEIEYVNPKFTELTGYTREEAIGRNPRILKSGSQPAELYRELWETILAGAEWRGEFANKKKNGKVYWESASIVPIKDSAGAITHFLAVKEDITVRKQAEADLRASEQRYRRFVERNAAGVFRTSWEGKFIDCNDAMLRMLGYASREELLGRSVPAVYCDPAHRQSMLSLLREKRTLSGYEIPIKLGDGSEGWCLANFTLAQEDGHEIIEGTIIDITERKRAEETRAHLAAIVEGSDDAIIGKNLDGIITSWNEGAARLYGYNPEEALGRPISIIIPPEESNQLESILQTIRNERRVERLETVRVRKDGTRVGVSVTISPIRNGAGAVIGAATIARDITARQQAEAEMRKAKEAAESANRAKSQFLANMSHEIRTPMNGVIGMAGLLLDTKLTPEQQQYASIVRASGEALLAVINDILDFSKIEARKLTLEITDFNLLSVLEYAAAVLAGKASEKDLELTCEIEPGTPCFLRGDPGRVRQVLVNLLGNAVKFTARGEVAVRVNLDAEDERAATLRFTVRDTGIGLKPDRVSSLFEPFVQGDGSRTRRYGGTGLGLTISKQLVEMMGGQVGFESEEGKGSTFWFTAIFTKQPNSGAQLQPTPPQLRAARVLVVDDNATNRALVSRLLSRWGCRPELSPDGISALALLRHAAHSADPYRFALLDLTLPGANGEELGRLISGDPHLKSTTLILMTGFGGNRDWTRLEALGFAGQVTKPIWEHTLLEALVTPRRAPENLSLAPAHSQPDGTRSVPVTGAGRILLVEDNPTNREVAAAMLAKLGYHTDVVANGVEALGILRNKEYDLVLMDCEMPEMDGYEATQLIRQGRATVRNSRIPILALTADAMKGDRDKCLRAGMTDYLSKPVDPRQLAATLRKWISKPAGASVPPANVPARTAATVFDQERFLRRLMGDRGMARKIISGFLSDIPRQLRTLKDKLSAGDVMGARLQAHSLKGAASTVSAEALQALCFETQEAAAAGELGRALVLLSQIEQQFELLKSTLKQSGWV